MAEPPDHDEVDNEWFAHLPPRVPAPIRLIIFPHAGAGCGSFAAQAKDLAGIAEVWAADLPGRQARFTEPARTELAPLVADFADAAQSLVREPYAVLGYCSGAVLGYAFVAELARRDAPLPRLFLPVSADPPDRVSVPQGLPSLPSGEFWEKILSYGGVPPALGRPEFRELFEPALRADYALLADHQPQRVHELDVPVTAIAGRDDPSLTQEILAGWSRHTRRGVTLQLIPGGHWLFDDDPEGVVTVIANELAAVG